VINVKQISELRNGDTFNSERLSRVATNLSNLIYHPSLKPS